MKISVWQNNKSENDSILDLTKKVFGEGEITQASYFDWQYNQNPSGKALILIAKDEKKDTIIGIVPIIPTSLVIDKKLVKSSFGCNVLVDSQYRNQGIFSKLLSSTNSLALKNEVSSFYGIPNESIFKLYLKNNFVRLSSLPLYCMPLKPSKYFNSPVGVFVKLFDLFWRPKTVENSNVEEFNGNFTKEFEKIGKKLEERVPIMVQRSAKFLQWRYRDHPTRKYKIFILKEDSELKGFLICRIISYKNKTIGIINDFVVDQDIKNKNHLYDLVKTALNDMRAEGASIALTTFNKKFFEGKILLNSGFFKIPKFLKPEQLYFITKLFEKNVYLEKMKYYNNWFFSFGDYDVF